MGLKCHPIEGPTQLAQFANLPCLLTQSRVVITMALALYFVPMDKFGRKIAVPKCARKSIPSKLHPLSKTAIASNTSIPFLPSLASLFLPSLASLTKPPYQEMALKCLPASKSSGLLNSESGHEEKCRSVSRKHFGLTSMSCRQSLRRFFIGLARTP